MNLHGLFAQPVGFFDLGRPLTEDKAHNRRVFDRAHEIEEQEWNEIWTILKGQDMNEYRAYLDSLTEEERKNGNAYYKWFDGSGMKHWWD